MVLHSSLWLIFVIYLTNWLLVTGDRDWPNPHDDYPLDDRITFSSHCNSYCDVYGYYRPPEVCYSPAFPVYCCGNEHFRECCTNSNHSVGDRYPDVSACPNSSWWLFRWRTIIGFLGGLVAIVMMTACCYYCCLAMFRDKARLRRARRRQIPAVSAEVEPETRPRLQLMFDPESAHAFTPPSYDSLPNKPPDYSEIVQAYANSGYVNEEENSNQPPNYEDPPPSYEAPPGDLDGRTETSSAN